MGSVPGPIITFRVDSPQLAGATAGAFQQIKNEARQTSNQIADDWKRMAAQIRASMALGTSNAREEAVARERIVSVLNSEISAYRTKNELSSRQLSDLKAMTLELERQKSHLVGTGGLTTGTLAAAGQMSTQTYLGVTRALDSIVNRYFGGAAGSAFRTVRDLGYYSAIGAGGAAGEGGAGLFGNLKAGLSSLLDSIPQATIAFTGMATALTALGTAAASITLNLARQNEAIENTAAATGLSAEKVQVLNEASRQLGLESGGVVTSIARFQSELGEYVRKGEDANTETIRFVAGLKSLGIQIEDQSGHLRDPITILSDLSDVLQTIPNPTERSARALDLLGVRGRDLVPILISSHGEFRDMVAEIERDGPIIGEGMAKQLDQAKGAWNLLTEAMHKNWLQTREIIASGFLSATGLAGIFANAPHATGIPEEVRRQLSAPLRPGDSVLLGANPLRPTTEKEIADYTKQEKKDEEERLAFAKRRAELEAGIFKAQDERFYRQGTASGAPHLPGSRGELYKRIFSPQAPNTPGLGIGFEAQTGNVLAGLGLPTDVMPQSVRDAYGKELKAQIDKEYKERLETRAQEYQAELTQLDNALHAGLIKHKDYSAAVFEVTQELHKELARENEKYNQQADELFQQLITGDRNFGRTLVKDLQESMLAPIRDSFDRAVGSVLGDFAHGVNAPFAAAQNGGGGGAGGNGALSRFATIPFFGKLISGLGGKSAAPTGAPGDPVHVVIGGIGASGVGIGAGAIGGGVAGPITDFLSAIGYTPSGPAAPTGSGHGGPLGFLSKLFGGGGSGSGGSGFSIATLLGSGGPSGGFSLGKLFGTGGLGNIAGTIGGGLLMGLGASTGGALGGLEGGLGGALSGALAGMAAGPIGAAIGAAIGGIGGLITGLIGPSWQTRVQRAERNQAYYAPPSETFSFASNGSIGSTLGTGFSQSGGRFSQFGLPAGTPFTASALTGPLSYGDWLRLQQENNQLNTGQPFLGFPSTNPYAGQGPLAGAARTAAPTQVVFNVNAIDAKGVSEFFTQHGETIAAMVGRNGSSSGSGLGSRVRGLVNLP